MKVPENIELEIYERIDKEISNNQLDRGLWLKCRVEANMDEKIAQTKYVKYRYNEIVKGIQNIIKAQEESLKRQQREQEKEEINEIKRKKQLKDKELLDRGYDESAIKAWRAMFGDEN